MRLSKTCGELLALVAMAACFAPVNWAQAPAANSGQAAAMAKPAAKTKATAKHKRSVAAKPAAPKPEADAAVADKPPVIVSKRDPFAPLISVGRESGPMNLPPGKAGLVIATVRVDGAVRANSGMIAIVSNPSNSVYFVREGDRLYDGDVEKIGLDGVTFRENSKDAFGHAVERTVTKRIYASAGEQQ